MITHKILNGFIDVLVVNDVYNGINSLMQTSGVGGFRPNTVNLEFTLRRRGVARGCAGTPHGENMAGGEYRAEK
jgi:hypothetical protein